MSDDDEQLRDVVIRELERDPTIDSAHVGVVVEGSVVVLTGRVSSYLAKLAALSAVTRVQGIRVLADELEVAGAGEPAQSDADLAEAVARALGASPGIPETVMAEVRQGLVMLRGRVRWNYEHEAAAAAVRRMKGVRAVLDLVEVDLCPILTLLYDDQDRPTDDPSLAIRGEVIEVDGDGRLVRVHRIWAVDPSSLDGNLGGLATRPRRRGETRV
ncbi:MAG: BON domain-containing protein [Gaiellaceae bacterium]